MKGEVQTPLTDALIRMNILRAPTVAWIDFARQLERENAQLVETIRDWECSMGVMVRRAPMCDPGFVAIYQNMQRILAKSRP